MNKLHSIDSKDWFINQKRIPDSTSEEAKSFYDFHRDLCLNGAMMDGIFINPFLYWHLNIWHTEVDIIDEKGRISQKYANPYLRDNEWIVTNEIERAHQEKKGLAIGGIRRLAKALKNDELLYNQEGSYPIKNAKIGDTIFDHNGHLTNITGVFPQGKIPVYKISLKDGREVVCCENHIWRVLDRRNGRSVKDLSIKKLLPIYKNVRVHNGYKNKITRNIEECFFAIPNNKCVEYTKKTLSVDPYFLGLWLGDGDSRMSAITTIDEPIKNYVYTYANSLGLKVRVEKDITYYINNGLKEETLNYNVLLNELKKLNLIENKHIPKEYLLSSKEQRMALLQGLMDTDGSVYINGTISFTTTKEQLAKDFFSLCRSLGINLTKKKFIPKLYGKNCGEGWLFTLFTEEPVFRLERKLCKIKYNNKGKQSKINWTTIKNIELIGEEESTCITVDNEDKLFLTTDYTVTHNSVIEASYIAWGAQFDENSQNVISGLNSPDIKLITDKIDKGLNFIPHYWRWQRIEDNWKNQVTLGIKTKAGERIPFSSILIRNLDEGNNEEAIAGTKPRKLIIDEGGKGSFLRGLQAAIPGFTTPYGWGCSPIVTFTGGDMTKFMDAKLLMFDVEAFNFLTYNNKDDEKRIHGLFLGHKYRMEAKEKSTLADYLQVNSSELQKIEMLVSNEEIANQITDKNLERAKKAGDRKAYLKEKMYYPKKVDDIFLNEDTNIFDIESAKIQKQKLLNQNKTGTPVILKMGESGVTHDFTDKMPITNYPLKPTDDKDAPVIIYEFPIDTPPYGLYVCGVDPYRQGKAAYSSSLGSVYIYKRMHSITGEKYQDMFVASYCARPDKKEKWEDQSRLLIKYYNARTLSENDEISFIDHMKNKGDAHYLEKQPDWLKEIVPNTTVSREYGIHRSSEKIINFLHGCLKKYTEEIIYEERNENGSVIRQVTGMSRILDPMLLEEMIQYSDSGNFDRIVSAELAIAQAMKMDPIFGKVGANKDSRIQSLGKNTSHESKLFYNSSGMFKKRIKNKLF